MDVLGFLSDFLGILANFIIYPISYLSIVLAFIGFCFNAVIKYVSLIINLFPPFLSPFALMLIFIRILKFALNRPSHMTRSSSINVPDKGGGKVNNYNQSSTAENKEL